MLNRKTVKIDGVGELEITELSARAYAEMLDARKDGKQEVEVSAIVSYHCAFKGTHESPDEVLDNYSPGSLMSIMTHVVDLSDLSPKKSGADRVRSSSSA